MHVPLVTSFIESQALEEENKGDSIDEFNPYIGSSSFRLRHGDYVKTYLVKFINTFRENHFSPVNTNQFTKFLFNRTRSRTQLRKLTLKWLVHRICGKDNVGSKFEEK